VVGIQDMGAAGLTCSTSEMGSRGGHGMDVDVMHVPQRESGMTPYEIMLSESQERMVAVVTPDELTAVEAVCRTWELGFAVVGEVTDSGELRAFQDGEEVGAIPVSLLTEETPRYTVETATRELAPPLAREPRRVGRDELLTLLGSPNVRSRRRVFERYDHLVGSRTVRRPGLDAAVLRLRSSVRGIAVSLDGPGRAATLDPRTAGARTVFEAARNVACAGGRPLAITDCLNFGNPEKPEIAWELTEAIEGMSRACEVLGIPVVSGNVSLYNETDGRSIPPTPVVGCVGLVRDVRAVPGAWREGDVVLLAGGDQVALDGSEYQAVLQGGPAGRPPPPDYVAEAALVHFLWRSAPVLSAAHDVSDGGLAVALAELALHSGVGAEVELEREALRWFGEGSGRAVIACRADRADALEGVPLRRLGTVGGGKLLGVSLADLSAAYEGAR
jgi:phosphoribosylformylglycinamidine synthase